MHTITTRAPTANEQRIIANLAKPEYASYGCIIIIFGIGPVYLLGFLSEWLGEFISPTAATCLLWIGRSIAVCGCVYMLARFIPYEREKRRLTEQDQAAQIVQDIHVVEPRVIEIGLVSDNEPILAVDIGDNRILFLQGQWLRDYGTYGLATFEGDLYEEFFNGLPAPHSFPSSQFTVSGLPVSGAVLGIRVGGVYLPPPAGVDALKPEYDFSESELLDGSLEEIASLLAVEHQRRLAKPTQSAGKP
jgi:hypothetical protein